ncbi:hypothetical protein [Agrococcus sediminis]|uniref:hypothetical protein n=1 Tax=Agrococcus sediminis TaxID=2599924 RepID=UPI00344A9CF4
MNTADTDSRDWVAMPYGAFPDEVDEDKVLAHAAAILAARAEAPPAEPEPVPSKHVPEGGSTLFHVLGDAVSIDGATWHERGSEFSVTHEQAAQKFDRRGRNTLDAWVEAGRVGLGPYPDFERPWVYGSLPWTQARDAASREAASLTDPDERAAAFDAVMKYFGPARYTPESGEKHYRQRMQEFADWRARQKGGSR